MSTPEQVAQQKILLRFGALPDLRIWRQNTGQAWQPLTPAAREAFRRLRETMPGGFRPVMYGTKGAADIQGILAVSGRRDVTDEAIGRFLAVEVKSERGRLSEDQERWGAMVKSQGGIYVVAKNEDDVGRALDAAREG